MALKDEVMQIVQETMTEQDGFLNEIGATQTELNQFAEVFLTSSSLAFMIGEAEGKTQQEILYGMVSSAFELGYRYCEKVQDH